MAASRPATEGGTDDACGIASGFVATTGLVTVVAVAATGAATATLVGATGAALDVPCASATAAGCFASATWKRLESVADTSATLRGRPSLSKKIERLARAALGKT